MDSQDLEKKLSGLVLAIKFRKYLVSLEVQSRRHLLDYCVQWLDLKKAEAEAAWFKNAQSIYMNDDEDSKKIQDASWQMWDDLYLNLSSSDKFQSLVKFFCTAD
jgi:hypothetical protein